MADLDALWARGREFLGTQTAIMAGAMTWISDRQLVSALSNAGGFGVIACGNMEPEQLREEIAATKEQTQKPFGVNLITLHRQLDVLIDECLAAKVGHIVLAGGIPPRSAIERIKAGGVKLICFAPALALAKKLVKSGADALIIEGSEAGGHIGPVSLNVLAQEILPVVTQVPVFVAGGIGRGESIASYLLQGASGVQLGTRFACAKESRAHAAFKQAFFRASARDAVASVQLDPRLPVIPVRALKNEGTQSFAAKQREVMGLVDTGQMSLADGQLEIEYYWSGALRRAVLEGDVQTGSLMAGQSVGLVRKEQPVAEILAELIQQAHAHLDRLAA